MDHHDANVDRYRRVQRFVDAFFPKIAEFQKPPRHAKWREVNLPAQLPGWTRFEAAQDWLDSQAQASQANQIPQASADRSPGLPRAVKLDGGARAGPPPGITSQADPALYQEFLQWKRQQGR